MLLLSLLLVIASHCTQAQLEKYKQSSGYVDVREGAHLFHWLFYTTAPVKNYTERPLIIWLAGGPGKSSSGYGNFINVGPLTRDLTERNETLIKNYNVLFLDSPVGVGFSYVDDPKLLTKTTSEIATDFMVFMQEFYRKNPEFGKVPLYLYGESYGAKMAVEIAVKLNEADKKGTIKSNLRGIFMESPVVSPLDYIYAWPRILNITALVEHDGYENVQKVVKEIERLYNNGQYAESRKQRNVGLEVMNAATTAVEIEDFFSGAATNLPDTTNDGSQVNLTTKAPTEDKFNTYMNSVVKKMLNVPETVTWILDSSVVYDAHIGDYIKPVVKDIEKLLNETDITIIAVNGNNDLFYNTLGQLRWVSKLEWSGAQQFKKSSRQPLWENNRLEGYYKKHGNFGFYEINAIGRYAAQYTPGAVHAILRGVTTFG